MLKACISCNNSFEGRKQAKTCSSRCRKRLQRLNQAATKSVKEIESVAENAVHKIVVRVEDEAKNLENSIQQLAENQAGFIAVSSQQEKADVSNQSLPLARPAVAPESLESVSSTPTQQPKPEPSAMPTADDNDGDVVKPSDNIVEIPIVQYLESPDPVVPNIAPITETQSKQNQGIQAPVKRRLFHFNKALLKIVAVSLLLTLLAGGNFIYFASRRQQNIATGSNQTLPEQSVPTSKEQLGLLLGDKLASAKEQELVVQGDGVFAGNIYAANFPGDTSTTDASKLTSGTLGTNRLSDQVTLQGNAFNGASQLVRLDGNGFLPALNGTALTSLNASNISLGQLSDARLSSSVALLNLAQTFSAAKTFGGAVVFQGSVNSSQVISQNGNTVCDSSNNCNYSSGGGNAFIQGGNSFTALAELGTNDSFGLAIKTVGTERIRIDTSGNVGLGTTTPAQKLDITGGNLRLDTTSFTSQTGIIYKDATRFLHNFNYGNNGTVTTDGANTFLGLSSGNFTMGSTATQTYEASYNTGVGQSTLQSNTTGDSNSALGTYALQANTTGIGNSALGFAALFSNTTGGNNAALGTNAGRYIADGSTANQTSNTSLYLGNSTKASANGNANEIVIGYDTTGNGSNSVTLGNTSITKTVLQGNVGIGDSTPNSALDILSSAASNTQLTIGNTNAGNLNPQIGFELVEGTNTFTLGVDDADGDKFKISTTGLGTNDRFVIDSSGNVGISTGTPAALLSVGSTSQFQVNTSGNVTYVSGSTNTSTYVCRNGSGQFAACQTTGSSGPAFIQGGNSFGQTAILGTNDNTGLEFETNGTTKLTLNTGGNLYFAQGANRTLNVAANTTSNGAGYVLTVAAGNANGSTTGNVGGQLLLQGGDAAGTGNNNGGDLLLQGGARTGAGITGSVIVKSRIVNSTNTFQVQRNTSSPVLTVDTANNITYLRGFNSTATEGSELFTTFGTATGWTNGCSNTCSTHTSGTTAIAALPVITTTPGTVYKVTYTISGSNGSGSVNFTLGLKSGLGRSADGTYTEYILANANDNLTFVPTSPFNGTVSAVSVKAMTNANSVLTVQNSDATTGLEIRAGGSGLNNAFIGTQAGANNVTGANNLALGASALQGNVDGSDNLAIGYQSLQSNSSGTKNIAIGYQTLQANTSGHTNSAIGYRALFSNTTGFFNSAIGESALMDNTSGYQNVGIGFRALENNTTGYKNTGIGSYALNANTSGYQNVGIGDEALYNNVAGSQNTAIGASALVGAMGQDVIYSTAVGTYALNAGANYSTAVGAAAGVQGGDYSVALGYNALGISSTKSVGIGYNALYQDPDATGFNSINSNGTPLSNATAIGYGSQVQQNNALVLGGQGINQVNIGIGTTRPSNVLSVSPIQYSAGTASQSGTAVTGTGTAWTSAMVGSEIIFADGKKATITVFNSATALTVDISQTVSSQTYRIHRPGLQVSSTGNVGIGDTTPAALLTVGNGDLFQINSSGDITTASTEALSITTGTTGSLTLDSGTTGAINMGTNANAKAITIGNSTGATSIDINCGTGACSFGANAIAHTTTIGSNTGTATTNLLGGTGGINIGTGGVVNAIQIGNTTGAVAQNINIGNNATASSTNTVTIGSTIGTSSTTLQSGSGHIILTSSGGGNVGIGDTSPAALFTVGNGDLFQVNSSGTIAAVVGITTSGTIQPNAASTIDLGSPTAEFDELFLGDNNGIKLGLDQDATLAYDEATDDRVELTGTGASMFIEDKLGLGRQTFTMSTAGAATENLTTASSYVEITGQDNAADLVQIQTIGAKEGDILYITNLDAITVNIDQTATTKLSGGLDKALTQYDVMILIFDGTNWLQAAGVVDNS